MLVLENLPVALNGQDCIIGIDEAGRGPVLGPLVYAIFVCPVAETGLLKQLSAGDSKEKSLEEREAFYAALLEQKEKLGWKVEILHPQTISNCMLRKDKYNLNTLSHDTVFKLIDHCLNKAGLKISQSYVDTLGPADKYEAKLSARFPSVQFTVRSKADALFPVVGAASIVAKVTRDRSLHEMMADCSGEFGCGYPSDPATVRWLQGNIDPVFGYSQVVRFSWSSCDRILQEKAVKVVWPTAEEAEPKTHRAISSLCGLS